MEVQNSSLRDKKMYTKVNYHVQGCKKNSLVIQGAHFDYVKCLL